MNDRIRELVRQAEKFANNFCDSIGDSDFNHWNDAFNDKFAELIVQECADIAKHHVMNISTYSDAEFVEKQILENFGVE